MLAAAAALGVFAFAVDFAFAFGGMAGLSKPIAFSFRWFCAMFPCVCSSYSLLGSSSSVGASPIVAPRIAGAIVGDRLLEWRFKEGDRFNNVLLMGFLFLLMGICGKYFLLMGFLFLLMESPYPVALSPAPHFYF